MLAKGIKMFNCDKCGKEINFRWGVDKRTLCMECCDTLETEAAELAEIFEGDSTPLEKGCTLAGLLENLIADRNEQACIGDILKANIERLEELVFAYESTNYPVNPLIAKLKRARDALEDFVKILQITLNFKKPLSLDGTQRLCDIVRTALKETK